MATPQVLEMLANDPLSKAIRQVFQACQDDSVSCGKSVSRFRKIYGQCETEKEKKSFFKKFIFYLQLPLTAKERSHYVDECLEVACKLVASYIEEAKEKEDKDKVIILIALSTISSLVFFFIHLVHHHHYSGRGGRGLRGATATYEPVNPLASGPPRSRGVAGAAQDLSHAQQAHEAHGRGRLY